MRIHVLTFNPFAENTYLLIGNEGSILIIDPGMMGPEEDETLFKLIDKEDWRPSRLILTHAHIDHVLGIKSVSDKYGLLPESHADGRPVYEACPQVAQMYGIPYFPGLDPSYNLSTDQNILLDGEELELRLVPGHAPGHLVIVDHTSKQIIAGDTLFRESIGRTDLPGGNHQLLLDKVRSELFSLGDDYEVWPGHGPSTTIGHEKQHNPFLQ